MPDKTPLELAKKMAAGDFDYMAPSKVRVVAAALVERMTPVEARIGTIQESPCCHAVLSGYPEDHFRRALPKFCNCGKPLVWK